MNTTDTICKECHKALCKCGPDDPFNILGLIDEQIIRDIRAAQDRWMYQTLQNAGFLKGGPPAGPPVDDEIDTADADWPEWHLDNLVILGRDDYAWFWSQVAQVALLQHVNDCWYGNPEYMMSVFEDWRL